MAMDNEKQEVLERMPSPDDNPQTALLREGAAIVRLENNTQMQIAVQRPRDEVKILNAALKELDTYPSMADTVMYRKPVGKDDNDRMKYAEGLSIRAAESLANRWTNSAYGCEIVSDNSEGVRIAAVFMDYENNTRHVIEKKVSRMFKKKNSTVMQRIPDDRFYDVVVPANQSKILREVINRSLPAGLKAEYEAKARKIMTSGDKSKMTTKLMQGFLRLGIAKSKLEELAGKKIEELTPEEIAEYIAIGNAISEGETTIDQLIVEKTSAETLADRMKNGVSKPAEQPKESGMSGEGLTGMRLKLYEKVATLVAGDVAEGDKFLSNLSAGKIKGKEDLKAAADALVTELIGKFTGGGTTA